MSRGTLILSQKFIDFVRLRPNLKFLSDNYSIIDSFREKAFTTLVTVGRRVKALIRRPCDSSECADPFDHNPLIRRLAGGHFLNNPKMPLKN